MKMVQVFLRVGVIIGFLATALASAWAGGAGQTPWDPSGGGLSPVIGFVQGPAHTT